MTAANPKAPFRAVHHSAQSVTVDADDFTLGWFSGPDRVARAEALAAEYEQTYGPKWKQCSYYVDGPNGTGITCWRSNYTEHDYALAARVADLLNEHGGPQ